MYDDARLDPQVAAAARAAADAALEGARYTMPKRKRRRQSKGKGKARDVERDAESSENESDEGDEEPNFEDLDTEDDDDDARAAKVPLKRKKKAAKDENAPSRTAGSSGSSKGVSRTGSIVEVSIPRSESSALAHLRSEHEKLKQVRI